MDYRLKQTRSYEQKLFLSIYAHYKKPFWAIMCEMPKKWGHMVLQYGQKQTDDSMLNNLS